MKHITKVQQVQEIDLDGMPVRMRKGVIEAMEKSCSKFPFLKNQMAMNSTVHSSMYDHSLDTPEEIS